LSYEDYDYELNRLTQKIFGSKWNKSISGYMMKYEILYCNTEDIRFIKYQVASSQNDLTLRFFLCLFMK